MRRWTEFESHVPLKKMFACQAIMIFTLYSGQWQDKLWKSEVIASHPYY